MAAAFKPNLKFLAKVAADQVYAYQRYSVRRGGYYGFAGGEATYLKHRREGYVTQAGPASLGRRGKVELTDLGKAALATVPTP